MAEDSVVLEQTAVTEVIEVESISEISRAISADESQISFQFDTLIRRTADIIVLSTLLVTLFLGGTIEWLEPWLPVAPLLIAIVCLKTISTSAYRPPTHQISKWLIWSASALVAIGIAHTVPLPASILVLFNESGVALANAFGSSTGQIALSPELVWDSTFWATSLLIFLAAIVSLPYVSKYSSTYPTRRVEGAGQSNDIFLRQLRVDSFNDQLERRLIQFGFLICIIAILHWATRTQSLFWFYVPGDRFVNTPRAHWPLMNPNHLCSIVNVIAVLSLGRALQSWFLMAIDPIERRSWERDNRHVGRLNSKRLKHALFPITLYLLCALVVLLTASRAGLAIFALASILVVSAYSSNKRSRSIGLLVLCIGALGITFLTGDAGRDLIASRIEGGLGSSGEMRSALIGVTFKIISESPVLGVGLGNWTLAADPHVNEALGRYTLNYAHNDLLQLVSELGLVGTAVVALPLSWVVVWGWKKFRALRASPSMLTSGGRTIKTAIKDKPSNEPSAWSPIERLRLLTILIAAGTVGLHSLVDFPFHVPAIAFLTVTALAMLIRNLCYVGQLNRLSAAQIAPSR